jgi:hypothetical protein
MLTKVKAGDLRRGHLLNGNPSGDFLKAPRCGATTRRGTTCQCPAIRGRRRCRLHGGLSTGPRTVEGLKKSRAAVLKHGRYSVIARQVTARDQELRESMRQFAATTLDEFMRELYYCAAESRPDAKALDALLKLVMLERQQDRHSR